MESWLRHLRAQFSSSSFLIGSWGQVAGQASGAETFIFNCDQSTRSEILGSWNTNSCSHNATASVLKPLGLLSNLFLYLKTFKNMCCLSDQGKNKQTNKQNYRLIFKRLVKAGKVVQLVKVLGTKPDNPSFTPRPTRRMERTNRLLLQSSHSSMSALSTPE